MLLSAWATEGTLELVPIAIFGLAAAAAVALGARMYASVIPGRDHSTHAAAQQAPAAA
jgi:hypothetical protein